VKICTKNARQSVINTQRKKNNFMSLICTKINVRHAKINVLHLKYVEIYFPFYYFIEREKKLLKKYILKDDGRWWNISAIEIKCVHGTVVVQLIVDCDGKNKYLH